MGIRAIPAQQQGAWPESPPFAGLIIDLRTGKEGKEVEAYCKRVRRVVPVVVLVEPGKEEGVWSRIPDTVWLCEVLPANSGPERIVAALAAGDKDGSIAEAWFEGRKKRAEKLEAAPLQGVLEEHPLAWVMLSMAFLGTTGALAMECGDGDYAYIYFKGGKLVDVQVPGATGWRLPVLAGKLGISGMPLPEQAAAPSLETQVGGLLSTGQVPFDQAASLLQEQCGYVLASLLHESGAYIVHEGVPGPGPGMSPGRVVDALASAAGRAGTVPGATDRVIIRVLPDDLVRKWQLRPRELRAFRWFSKPKFPVPPVEERLAELGDNEAAADEAIDFLGVLNAAGLLEEVDSTLDPQDAASLAEMHGKLIAADLGGRPEALLGIPPGASPAVAEDAFRKLSLKHHPDRYHRSHPRLKKVAEAFGLRLNASISDLRKGLTEQKTRDAPSARPSPPPAPKPPSASGSGASSSGPTPELHSGESGMADGLLTKEMARPLYVTAQRWIRQRSYTKALKDLNRAHQADPEDVEIEINWHWVRFLVDRSHGAEAERRLQKIVREEPEHSITAYVSLVRMLRLQHRYEDARALVKKGLRVAPHSVELGREQRLLDSYEDSKENKSSKGSGWFGRRR